MKMLSRSALLLFASVMPLLGCRHDDSALPVDGAVPALASLGEATIYEVLALNPNRDPAASATSGFHGYQVLGRTSVDETADRATINRAVREWTRPEPGVAKGCVFMPRHGLHVVTANQAVDLVVCFACHDAQLYVDEAAAEQIWTTELPKQTLDRIIDAAGLKTAD